MTNKEYLDALANEDPRRLAAWFASTHVDAERLFERIEKLERQRDALMVKLEKIREAASV